MHLGRWSFGSAGPWPGRLGRIQAVVLILVIAACGSGAAPASGPTSTIPAATPPHDAGSRPATAYPAGERGYDLQGHRGARGLRPENTLPGFEAALDLMVDTLELDLHFSGDRQVVVWHDPVLDPAKCRLPEGGSVAGVRIAETGVDDLAALRCDMNPDPGRFPDQSPSPGEIAGDDWGIVTLDRLFAFVDEYGRSGAKTDAQRVNATKVRFNVETKRVPDDPATIGDQFDGVRPGAFELAILEVIDRHDLAQRVTIQSFDHRSLWAVASVAPAMSLAALTPRGEVPDLAELAERGATIWSPSFSILTADLVGAARAADLAVVPWTVNEPSDMSRLLGLGVDGIITDRPDLAPPAR